MKRFLPILFLGAGMLRASINFPYFGWELASFNYSVPFAESPSSFSDGGTASSAKLSANVVLESVNDRSLDNLPSSGIYGKGWPQGFTPDPDKYIEFTISPSTLDPVYVGSIQLPFFQEIYFGRRGEEGPRRWALRWSVDGFATNIVPEIQVTATFANQEIVKRVDLWQLGATYGSITFRLYGYDAPSAEGSGGLRVVSKLLYIIAANRPPLFDIPPTITFFPGRALDGRYFLTLKGAYGDSFNLEYSYDLSTWSTDPIAPVTIDNIENEVSVSSSGYPNVSAIFFRFKKRG